MTYNEKKSLYESVMLDIAKIVKRKINESFDENDEDKVINKYKNKVLVILKKILSLKLSFYKNKEPFPTLKIVLNDYAIRYEFEDSIAEFLEQANTDFSNIISENAMVDDIFDENDSSELILECPTAASVYEDDKQNGHPIDDKTIQEYEEKISLLKTVECCYHGAYGFVVVFKLDEDLKKLLFDVEKLYKIGKLFKQYND